MMWQLQETFTCEVTTNTGDQNTSGSAPSRLLSAVQLTDHTSACRLQFSPGFISTVVRSGSHVGAGPSRMTLRVRRCGEPGC